MHTEVSSPTTPPESLTPSPLTPPSSDGKHIALLHAAAAIVTRFEDIKAGRNWPQSWERIDCSDEEYNEVERLLRKDSNSSLARSVEGKLRWDRDGDTQQLIFRMPTLLHECFARQISRDLLSQLQAIGKSAEHEVVQNFAKCIVDGGSGDLRFSSEGASDSKHSPDGTYYHEDEKWPGVILEISYSQKRRDVARLADRYILDSNAEVRAVLAIDIEYLGVRPKGDIRPQATFSIWRPIVVEVADGHELRAHCDVEDQLFRDANGDIVSSEGIQLKLSDFAHPEAFPEIKEHDQEIIISANTLCEYLAKAEYRLQMGAKPTRPLRMGTRKRRCTSTPPDVPTESEEENYVPKKTRSRGG